MKKQTTFIRILILPVLFILSIGYTHAQQGTDSAGVKRLLDKAEAYQKVFTSEKLYLNFDKPYYAVGDTAWIKAYVLMGDNNQASAQSAKLYVELMNNASQLVKRLVLPVAGGLAQGYLALDEKAIPEGSYTIRAYTNWLQNFGSEHFFYKQLYIGKLVGKTWLLTEEHRSGTGADTNHITLAMRFNDAKGLPIVTRPVSIKILDGTKTILKSEMSTGVDGALTGTFTLPAKANKHTLSISVDDANDKSQHIAFPFYPSGAGGDIDLQFMPEGGNLIAGLYNRIGFKAVGEDGLSREVKGVITDSKGQEAATLQSVHNGMGNFVLVPQPGETYTAKLTINGKQKSYPLPKALTEGIALRVDGVSHPDELYVYITANATDDKRYTLVAQSAGQVYFGSGFKFNGDGFFNTRIAKSKFPTGIVSLTILGADNKPLNQRSVFINHHDGLKVAAMFSQSAYAPKDSISLNLHVTNNLDNPVQATFSVAVTDDAQIKDAIPTNNIQSHILLASELKGHMENPAWYFEKGDEKLKERALDNLLLTQGWTGFDWNKVNAPITIPLFQPEPDINLTGKLKNLFGKPATGLKVELLANGKHPFFQDTVSDKDGRFLFKNLPVTDTVAYLIKLHNKRDKSATAEILVDEFKPANAALAGQLRTMPWNMNADTSLINYITKAGERNQQADQFIPPTDIKLLKQVDIKAQRQVKYVGGEFGTELLTIDEKELISVKKMSLLELITKKLPGFHQSNTYAENIFSRTTFHRDIQFVNGTMLINDIIADGQSVADPTSLLEDVTVSPNGINGGHFSKLDMFESMNNFLNYIGADDVKSIKLYRGTQLSLVIETRSHNGPYTRSSLGTYAYHPLPMQLPRQFYSPKYNVKDQNPQPDLRSTIHWEPNLVTGENGNARLSFYAADKPATYTVVIEGTDMQGHFGVSTGKITISQRSASVK